MNPTPTTNLKRLLNGSIALAVLNNYISLASFARGRDVLDILPWPGKPGAGLWLMLAR